MVFTPYLEKAKERLPPTPRREPIADTDEDTGVPTQRLVVGATIAGIVGVVAIGIARRLRIRRRDSESSPGPNERP